MSTVFEKTIDGWQSWGDVYTDCAAFAPLVRAIYAREGLPVPEEIGGLTPGTNAVFRCGDTVVKIFAPPESGFDSARDFAVEKAMLAYAQAQGAPPEDLARAVLNLEKLAARKAKEKSSITIGSQCVLTPENRDTVLALAARLKGAGADYFSIKYFYPHASNAYSPDMGFVTSGYVAELRAAAAELSGGGFSCIVRDPESLVQTRPYRTCLGLPFIVYVREDGMLYSCFSHQDDPATAIGSLLDGDFKTLWNNEGKSAAFAHINECIVKETCQANCRHHQINLWLWRLSSPPEHVNFI